MTCIFCEIAAGRAPADVVLKNEWVTAFHDINPTAPTHILVIPNAHITSLDELDDPTLAAHLLLACREVAQAAGLSERGYRVLTNVGRGGGQHVFHLHWHVIGGRRLAWPPG